MLRALFAMSVLASHVIALPLPVAAQEKPLAKPSEPMIFFTLGAGDVAGGYYSAAATICDAVNRIDPNALRCSPEPTPGSLYNLTMVEAGELDFAFTQSDWQKAALDGDGPFADEGPSESLRSVISLYPEPITVLVRKDADIRVPNDLLGKRVDIGPPASGRNASIQRLLQELGFDLSAFGKVSEDSSDESVEGLCNGRLEVAFFVMGHPNATVARALEECPVTLLPFSGPDLDKLLRDSTDYAKVVIPISTYPQLGSDITSYAVNATIVTMASEPDATVDSLVTTILDNIENLQGDNAIFSVVSPQALRERAMSAPLHPGAEAAFKRAAEKPGN